MSEAEIRGALSQDAVRRAVGRRVNEARRCYAQELSARPALTGRVSVRLASSGTGSVQTATVSSSTLGSPAVEACVVSATRGWVFPAPDGRGVVDVEYPFVLERDVGGAR